MSLRGIFLTGVLRFFGMLPLSFSLHVGTILGELLYRLPNRSLQLSQRNIELCFPELDADQRQSMVRASLHSMVQAIFETGWFWYQKPQRVMAKIRNIHGLEILKESYEQGKGVVLAAPHLGCWEILGQYLPSQFETDIMYKRPKDPGVEQVIIQGRERTGVKLIPADSKGVRDVFKAIKQGHLIGILPDQQPKAGQGQFAPFFGIEAQTMVLISKIVHKTACPVVIAWAERLPRGAGYDLHFSLADSQISDPDLRVSVSALNRSIEQKVRQCPTQYQWGYKRFGIRPEGEASLY